MASSPSDTSVARAPYRTALAACVGAGLGAGLVTALVDTFLTTRGAAGVTGGDTATFLRVAGGLYLGVGLMVGLAAGVVTGAIRATHGEAGPRAAWRRLAADEALDRKVTAAVLAGAVCALVLVAVVAVLALGLVAKVERKGTGAVLAGLMTAAAVPLLALGWYPAYRVTRRLAPLVPRLGGLPALVVLVGAALAGGLLLGGFVIVTQLDWRALRLGPPLMLLTFAAAMGGLLGLFYGPLAGLRARVPARGALVAVAAMLGVVAPLWAVRATPAPRAQALLLVESRGARPLVQLARGFGDKDGDGYSTWLGGGDCDDGNPDVNPGATEKPGNGVDENCNGADAPARPATPAPTADAGPGGPVAPGFAWKGNVLIIAVDTLRADRLGVAGYRLDGKSLTPRMDALAEKGVWFTRAWAQAPHTPRSFPSLFASRYPSAIKWDKTFSNYPKMLGDNLSVFEVLQQAGLETVGVGSHFYLTEERGITQGFTKFDNQGAKSLKDSNTDIAAPRIVPRAAAELARLAAEKKRFAMFVHLFEPHSTYVALPGVTYKASGGRELFMEKYDREVEFVDRYVGELVDAVAAAGLTEDTMIVIVSDHGEAFFTHSYAGQKLGWHGSALYDDQLRVPVIMFAPGLAPRRVDTPIMLLDVAPTLVEALGLPVPAEFQGRSLVPALAGGELSPRPVHAELLPYPNNNVGMKMRVDGAGKWKIVQNFTDRVTEVFDLEADPGEQKNLAFDDPARAKALEAELAGWVDTELAP